jgi:hypothetical protein
MTGEPDMVPEFCFNWITVPRVTVETFTPNLSSAPNSILAAQAQPALPPSPPSNPPSTSSSKLMANTLHSSPTPSTSRNRPAPQSIAGSSRNL